MLKKEMVDFGNKESKSLGDNMGDDIIRYTQHACCRYFFTLKAEDVYKEIFLDAVKLVAKKWAFQIEKGPKTGYLHYQGVLSLKTKVRQHEIESYFNKLFGFIWIRPVKEWKRAVIYVIKGKTRVDGPWIYGIAKCIMQRDYEEKEPEPERYVDEEYKEYNYDEPGNSYCIGFRRLVNTEWLDWYLRQGL